MANGRDACARMPISFISTPDGWRQFTASWSRDRAGSEQPEKAVTSQAFKPTDGLSWRDKPSLVAPLGVGILGRR